MKKYTFVDYVFQFLEVMRLQSNLMVTQQLGDQLMKGYKEFLQK